MLLLVTDTSGKHGSVALARAEEGSGKVELIEDVPLLGGTFSAQLVPQISGLLAKHEFSKSDIGGFVVVSGPGSFTGLRVGLAAIKALAEILQKPIVPVSLLEVIALASERAGKVLALLDGGRGEVYAGEYEINGGAARLVQEQLLPKRELVSQARGMVVCTADEALAQFAREHGVEAALIPAVGASGIGRLGWQKLQNGSTVSSDHLEANYIRRSDAEIFSKNT